MQGYIFYQKKNIYGSNVKIYRKKNSKKEYIKYKNEMISIKVYKKLKRKNNYKKKSKGGDDKKLVNKATEIKKQIEICCANSANDAFKLNLCLSKYNISRIPNDLRNLCNANKNYETNRIISNRSDEIGKRLRFENKLKSVEHRTKPSLYSDKELLRRLRGLS